MGLRLFNHRGKYFMNTLWRAGTNASGKSRFLGGAGGELMAKLDDSFDGAARNLMAKLDDSLDGAAGCTH